jgi:KaiC/GvpD/RAD55 family RecA-like ATPase
MGEIIDMIRREFEKLKEPYIVLVVTSAASYQEVNKQIIKYMIDERNLPSIYVTINKPYETVKKVLGEVVDTRLIIFIDAITRASGGKPEREKGCLFIDSPRNLTDLSIAISEAAQSIPVEKKFVFFDTLSTLLIYNTAGTVARFTHFLIGRIRMWNAEGVLLSLEKEAGETLLSQISQFCDATIFIGDESVKR